MLIDGLLATLGPSTRVQVANGGRWEHALVTDRRSPTETSRLEPLLEDASDIAIEVFLSRDDQEAFLGLRLTDQQRDLQTLEDLVAGLEGVASGDAARHVCQEQLEQPGLFTSIPAFAELGVVDAWNTLGALRLPSDLDDAGRLAEMLADHPHLVAHRSLPIALELGWTKPQAHWIGLPVSSGSEDGYSLDIKMTVALVRGIL